MGIFDKDLEQLHKWSIDTDTSDHTGELLLKTFMILLLKRLQNLNMILTMLLESVLVFLDLLILILELYTELLIYIGQVVSM